MPTCVMRDNGQTATVKIAELGGFVTVYLPIPRWSKCTEIRASYESFDDLQKDYPSAVFEHWDA